MPNLVQLLLREALAMKMSAAMLNRLLDRPNVQPFSEACIDVLRSLGVEQLSDLCVFDGHQIPTLPDMAPDEKSYLGELHASLKRELMVSSLDLPILTETPVATLSSYDVRKSFQFQWADAESPALESTQTPVVRDNVEAIDSDSKRWPEHEANHFAGTCQPCAYYFKPDSCKWGAKCDFCHLCPDGEIKARKKEKIRAMREQAQREKCSQQNPQVVSLSLSSALTF